MVWHSRFVTTSTWSSTTVIGRPGRIAETNLGTKVIPAPDETSEAKTLGSSGSTRFTATATALSSTTGSLSPSSQETQATRGASRLAN